MDETALDGWPDTVPWWVDAPTDAELADAVPFTDPPWRPSVAETLIEAGLAGPGPDAQRLLASLVGRSLTPDEALTAVQLWEAQEAWLVGHKHLALAAFAGPEPVTVDGFRDDEALVHELGPAWGSTVEFAGTQIRLARLLSGTLTATGDRLRAGTLSPFKARMIADKLGDLPPETARQVEARVLPGAAEAFPRTLARRLQRAIVRADPHNAETKHRDGRNARSASVDTEERVPGLLGLAAYLPPGIAIAVGQRLEAKAAQWAAVERAAVHHSGLDGVELTPADGDGDGGFEAAPWSGVGPVDGVLRTKPQRMADALAWYILGPDPDDPLRPREPTATIHVTVDLPTLLRLQDNPADLDHYGTLPPEIARQLAGDAQWKLLVHDPVDGHLLNQGRRTYRPKRRLQDYITARDVTCRYPGSTLNASTADTDHTIAYNHDHPNEGGETSADNLATLSRRAHRVKTFLHFTYQHLGNGILQWTTPLGRTYITKPHNYRGGDDGGDRGGDGDPPEPLGTS
ncbi:hypothetical protein acdb102_03290 [Acidothermaceae bacterium B102]|nr:hypothetical protein acdb102_03290 [Acidothermaceae bacterium B102]